MKRIRLLTGLLLLAVLTASCGKKTSAPGSEGKSGKKDAEGVSNGKEEAFYSYKRSYVTEDYAL